MSTASGSSTVTDPAALDDADDVDGTVAVLALPIPVIALGMLVDALELAYGRDLRARGGDRDTLVVFRS
jgi:hypothetical protein